MAQLDLRAADLRKADLTGTHLEGANLADAHLEEAHLGGARLEQARLSGAFLKGTNLEGAFLKGANLFGAHLQGAALIGAHLERADLGRARLVGAKATASTSWPDGFDWQAAGVIMLDGYAGEPMPVGPETADEAAPTTPAPRAAGDRRRPRRRRQGAPGRLPPRAGAAVPGSSAA